MRFLLLVLALTAGVLTGCAGDDVETMPFEPDFVDLVESGQVDRVDVSPHPSGKLRIRGWTRPDGSPGTRFQVEVLDPDRSIPAMLEENGVGYSISAPEPEPESWLSPVMFPALIALAQVVLKISVLVFVLWLALRLVRAVERIADNTKDR